MLLRFSVATLSRFVARFARAMIEDPSFNRFTLNGIPEIACHIVLRHYSKNENRKFGFSFYKVLRHSVNVYQTKHAIG